MTQVTLPAGAATAEVDAARRVDPVVPAWAPRLALVSTVVCVCAFAVVHLLTVGTVDPISQPVSVYALDQPGTILFGLGTLSMAAACAALAAGGLGFAGEATTRRLLGATAAMLALVVAFPTDRSDVVTSMVGEVHRWSASAAFVLITVVGWSAGRRVAAGPWRRALTLLAVCSALALLTTAANTFLPGVADGDQWRGMPQRVLLAIQAVLIVTLALAVTHSKHVRAGEPSRRMLTPNGA